MKINLTPPERRRNYDFSLPSVPADPIGDMMAALRKIRENRVIVLCHPNIKSRLLAELIEGGLYSRAEVRESELIDEDKLIIVNPSAMRFGQ